jgi:putative restriction endonuclease
MAAVPRFGHPQTVLPRLGQGAFRVIVTDVYKRQCALTNSHILHVLDAAHIRPYGVGGTHDPNNGLLLRQDIHTLFDRGYLTITPELAVEVSRRLKDEFDNGKEYYALHGKQILVPDNCALHTPQAAGVFARAIARVGLELCATSIQGKMQNSTNAIL